MSQAVRVGAVSVECTTTAAAKTAATTAAATAAAATTTATIAGIIVRLSKQCQQQ